MVSFQPSARWSWSSASYNHERGDLARARLYGERLLALDPQDPGAQALLAQVSRPKAR